MLFAVVFASMKWLKNIMMIRCTPENKVKLRVFIIMLDYLEHLL